MSTPLGNRIKRLLGIILALFVLGSSTAHSEDCQKHRQRAQQLQTLQQAAREEQQRLMDQYQRLEAAKAQVHSPEKLQKLQAAMDALKARSNELQRAADARARAIGEETKAAAPCAEAAGTDRSHPQITAMEGTVQILRGNDWVTATPQTSLNPGEQVRTGTDGRLTLSFGSDGQIRLDHGTLYHIEAGKESIGKLLSGRIHSIMRPCGHGYKKDVQGQCVSVFQTKDTVATVRGTEFDLEVDDQGLTRLTPYESTVEFSAIASAPPRERLIRWWTGHKPSGAAGAPLTNAVAKVIGLKGLVRCQSNTKAWQPCAPGTLLHDGDRLVVEPGALATVALAEGYIALVGAASTLEFTAGVCAVVRGALYVQGKSSPGQKAPVFGAPGVVCGIRGTEFEYVVHEDRSSSFMVYAGTISVTADPQQMRLDKSKAWW